MVQKVGRWGFRAVLSAFRRFIRVFPASGTSLGKFELSNLNENGRISETSGRIELQIGEPMRLGMLYKVVYTAKKGHFFFEFQKQV